MKTRDEIRRAWLWAVVRVVGLAVLGLVLLWAARSAPPETETPTAQERAAQFAGQARYYEVLDRYGDTVGAAEAARLVYESAAGANVDQGAVHGLTERGR